MRLPGREEDLVAGFLAAEGVISHPEDLLAVEPCLDPESGEREANVWNAALAEGVAFDPRRARLVPVSTSCGLCGVRTIAELRERLPAAPPAAAAPPLDVLEAAFERLRAEQGAFAETAGTHAAGLLALDGPAWDLAEDVGRHNAADKVLGARLRAGEYPLRGPAALLVSGRISFEIVQKAALAGVAAVAGVGAPTSLAVEAAADFGLTLDGLVRDGRANRYVSPPKE